LGLLLYNWLESGGKQSNLKFYFLGGALIFEVQKHQYVLKLVGLCKYSEFSPLKVVGNSSAFVSFDVG